MSAKEYSEMVGYLKEMVDLLKNIGVSEEKAKERAEEINKEHKEELKYLEDLEGKNKASIEQQKRLLDLRLKYTELGRKEYETQLAILQAQEEQNKAINTMADQYDELFDTLTGVSDKWQKTALGKLFSPDGKGFEALAKSFNKTFTVANILGSSMMKVQEATLELAYAQDSALAEFNKSTGAARLYGDQILQLESDMYRYGVSMNDATQVTGDLINNMKGFNTLSGPQQKNLMETTAILNELGVNSDITAGNIETMTRIMGLNTDQAAAQSREMFTLAQSLGMPPAEMAEAFRSASPQMAKFGSQGTEVFKKLAVNARAAGMEVDQILGIVEKFDTFEGAADSVGKLNAMLGGPFLNSLEMVRTTDPTERMKLLSDGINAAGKSFDEMGYYERQAIANAAGLKDVSELALVMAGEFDNMTDSTTKSQSELIDLANQQKEFNDITEEFNQLMRMFAINMRPVVGYLNSFMQGIQDANAATGGWLSTIITGVAVLAALRKITILSSIATMVWNKVTGMSAGIQQKQNIAIQQGGAAGSGAAPGMLAFGAAVLMVGAGVGLAALGISYLVASFKDLGAAAPYAVLGIVAFTAAFALMISLLIGLVAGPQAAFTAAAVGVLNAVALAALAVGAAVGLAAVGMSLFLGSFVNLFANVSVAQMLGLGASMILLSYGMYALAASAYALPLLVASMFGLGMALSLIDTSSLAPLAALFVSIDSILSKNIENLTATKEAITEIVDSINNIDSMEKTIAVKKIIDAVQGAAGSNRITTAGAASGGTSSSGGTFVPNGTPFTIHVDLAGRTIDTYMLKFLNGRLGLDG